MTLIKFRSVVFTLLLVNLTAGGPEEEEGVKYANKCEGKSFVIIINNNSIICVLTYNWIFIFSVCKVVATELEARLDETGKTRDVLEIGYSIDDVVPKKKKEYVKS